MRNIEIEILEILEFCGENYWNTGFAKIRNWSSPTNHKWKEDRLKVVGILKCLKSGLAEYSDIHFEGIEPAKSLVSC